MAKKLTAYERTILQIANDVMEGNEDDDAVLTELIDKALEGMKDDISDIIMGNHPLSKRANFHVQVRE
jgi:hypothetical protein